MSQARAEEEENRDGEKINRLTGEGRGERGGSTGRMGATGDIRLEHCSFWAHLDSST